MALDYYGNLLTEGGTVKDTFSVTEPDLGIPGDFSPQKVPLSPRVSQKSVHAC